ncbi:MAG: MFS transporter [Propionibacteriaceae bacterium]|jgi:MFS family permease|nr:MFS transporter [Propionibacteriaceae bacterium]
MFASLKIRNYRLFYFGGFVSNVGTWMARIAQDWLVLTELTDHSSTALGVTTALQFLPALCLVPWTGTAADRFDKRRLLILTQLGMLATSLTLALLAWGEVAALWHVYALAALSGVGGAFDGPARQAFAPEMVPKRLIPNAVGLNTTSFHAARLIGPAVAGISIASWGVAPALLANSISYLPVIAALLAMRPAELDVSPPAGGPGAVTAGLRYVRGRPDIIILMFVVFMLGTFGLNFQVSNALMATVTFGLGADDFGFLSSIMAVGSLAAGLWAAKRANPGLRLTLFAMAGFGAAMTVLSFAPTYWFYAVMLAPAGFASLTVMTSANASVQLAVEPEMRGRVLALYHAIFLGGTPIGAPIIGWMGDALGPRWTIGVGAVTALATVAAVVVYVVRKNGWEWPGRRAGPDEEVVSEPTEDVR